MRITNDESYQTENFIPLIKFLKYSHSTGDTINVASRMESTGEGEEQKDDKFHRPI